MTQIVADAEQARQLGAADGPVQVVDEKGTVIGVCTPITVPHSPYSREEIERRREEMRKHPEKGKSLAEVWKTIYEKYVGDEVEPLVVKKGNAVG
ncbi:MAG: hypothetical protein JWO38_3821 [Gemmataceae bacterium]|nr:hypothetical protein [Gemmataceae bacterium]